ncbi:MAG: VWA domain-containing protein [Spirochaetota bacterium]|nr:VWA domain-containing protein [Spirochaetota bacterium]
MIDFLTEEKPLAEIEWPKGMSRDLVIGLAERLWEVSPESSIAFLNDFPLILPHLIREEFTEWDFLGRMPFSGPFNISVSDTDLNSSSSVSLSRISFHYLYDWVELGLEMAKRFPNASAQYFQSLSAFLENGEPFYVRKWIKMAMKILVIDKAYEVAVISLLKSSPVMLQLIPFKEHTDWIAVGQKLLKRSVRLASNYFLLTPNQLGFLYRTERKKFFKLISLLVDESPENAVEFYQKFPDVLLNISPTVRGIFIDMIRDISSGHPEIIIDTCDEIVSRISALSNPSQDSVMRHVVAIASISLDAARGFFQNVSYLVMMPETFLLKWVEKGLSLLHHDEKSGIDYFSLASDEANDEILRWNNAVLLDDYRNVLSLYAQALVGKRLKLQSTEDLNNHENSPARFYPTSDGNSIYLPPFAVGEHSQDANFRQYKVAVAHQAGYIEFGTFESGLSVIMAIFESLPQKDLALDIFIIIEDGRIDWRLKEEYAGLRKELNIVIPDAIDKRTCLKELPLQEALVEVLLRLSVGHFNEQALSAVISGHVDFLINAFDGFYERAQGVWDSLQKAMEIYHYLSALSNTKIYRMMEIEDDIACKFSNPYSPSIPIPFRGRLYPDIIPDPIQLDIQSIECIDDNWGSPMPLDELKGLCDNIRDLLLQKNMNGEDKSSQGLFITDIDGLNGMDGAEGQNNEEYEEEYCSFVTKVSRSTEQEGPFYYDEWDYLQRDYRKKWCCIREGVVDSSESGIIESIYNNYSELIKRVRRQFQRIRPEAIETVRRVEWGDEIDLPAMIQWIMDRKANVSPSDKIFCRRERKARRIATLLLVDMSASTDELVPTNQVSNSMSQDSMLSQCSGGAHDAQKGKRIIDIEIESLVVMMEALDALDDEYAIFGFSGYGRQKVDFYRIKDFSESYSDSVRRRVSGIKPRQSTRMGAAIRHAIEKMRLIESDQRLLILLSDGFPQDHDYGEDRRSREYALNDTMMALLEAKKDGILPFCITVDQSGNDYLRKMCNPNNYLVIKDIYTLPEVMPKVVESLIA